MSGPRRVLPGLLLVLLAGLALVALLIFVFDAWGLLSLIHI